MDLINRFVCRLENIRFARIGFQSIAGFENDPIAWVESCLPVVNGDNEPLCSVKANHRAFVPMRQWLVRKELFGFDDNRLFPKLHFIPLAIGLVDGVD